METRVHVSIEVSDLDQAVQFYSRLFQAEPTKRRSDYANFRLETPQLHLALVHNPKRLAEPQSNRHYGIELFADAKLASWRHAVEKSGLKLRIEEQTTCCYAVADKFWAKDPDGHEWEFWVRHAEAETMHEVPVAVSSSNDSACCAPAPETVVKKDNDKSAAATCCAPGNR